MNKFIFIDKKEGKGHKLFPILFLFIFVFSLTSICASSFGYNSIRPKVGLCTCSSNVTGISNFSLYVPFTGATSNVDIGINKLTAGSLALADDGLIDSNDFSGANAISLAEGSGGLEGRSMIFWINNVETMVFNTTTRYAGIGTLLPNSELEVNGAIQLSANTTARPCNAQTAGAIYYDNTTFKHYGCNITKWNALY